MLMMWTTPSSALGSEMAQDPWKVAECELVITVLKHPPTFNPCVVGSSSARVSLATKMWSWQLLCQGFPVEKLQFWGASPVEIHETKVKKSSTNSLPAEIMKSKQCLIAFHDYATSSASLSRSSSNSDPGLVMNTYVWHLAVNQKTSSSAVQKGWEGKHKQRARVTDLCLVIAA